MGDIGQHFPDTDERYRDADSMLLLRTVVATLADRGLAIAHVDATVVMERPKLAPHRDAIRASLADGLAVAPEQVNVKASTGEGMGFVGRGEGVAALAVATVRRPGDRGSPFAQTHLDLVLLAVLSAVSVLLIVAYHSQVPYPILLVVGGAALGFVPGIPDVQLNPDVVLVIVLPPLLYAAAFFSSLHDVRDNLGSISLLAIGLVIATMVGVAVVAHEVIDGMSWQAAFVLGAVVSPTDPVAASAIAARVGAPRRYRDDRRGRGAAQRRDRARRLQVRRRRRGQRQLLAGRGERALRAQRGRRRGDRARGRLRRRPAAQGPRRRADRDHDLAGDAVLRLSAGRGAGRLGRPRRRHGGDLPGVALARAHHAGDPDPGLLGMGDPRLRPQRRALHPRRAAAARRHRRHQRAVDRRDRRLRVAVSAAVIVVRFLWVFPSTYLPRLVSRRIREREPAVHWHFPAIVAWTGMRGAVSLAAALAIPTTIDAGGDFPQRDLIIFLTYAVILATLILQGTTLPMLIRVLGVEEDGNPEQRESKARLLAARAALDRIEELRELDWVRDDTADRMRGIYDFRIRRFSARFDDEDDGAIDRQSQDYQRLRRKVLEAERAEIIRLRNVGKINDEIMRRIERDLDLEDTRLEV